VVDDPDRDVGKQETIPSFEHPHPEIQILCQTSSSEASHLSGQRCPYHAGARHHDVLRAEYLASGVKDYRSAKGIAYYPDIARVHLNCRAGDESEVVSGDLA
jgi:hypothetical protein